MRSYYLLLTILFATTAQSQVSLNSSYYQVMGARALGPSTMSGRITAIEGITLDNQLNLYVGTAGGGIWKSQNGGQSFSPIFDKYCQSIGALAIEPGNGKTVYAGTGESNMRNSVSIGDGIYKTTDGGANWQKIGLDSTEHISKIIIDPTDKKTIYVSAPGPLWSNSTHRGLYKSTDAGKTWNKILYVNDETGCADIAVHPQKSNVILASFWQFRRKPYSFNSGGSGSSLFKSIDGGKTWNKIRNGLPEGDFGRIIITMNPSKPSQIFAIVEAKESALYVSDDEGDNWKKLASNNTLSFRPFYFSTLVVDPKDPKRLYRPAFSFEFSTDGGLTWTGSGYGGVAPHADHHALWVNPSNTDVMYLGTDGGVYLSTNRGTTWQFLNNLPVGQFYHVSTDNKKPYNIYGGLQDNNNWIAPSSSPGGVVSTDWRGLGGGDGFWVQPDPIDGNSVFAESQGGEMYRIDMKRGLSFDIQPQLQKGDSAYRWNWNTPIVIGTRKLQKPGSKSYNLYTGSQYLFRSVDEGKNWERISPDLTTNNKTKQQAAGSGGITGDNTSAENHCTIFTIAQDPKNENVIWVGTDDGNVQLTKDGGKTWVNKATAIWKTGVPEHSWISCIEISSINTQRIYVTLENHMYGDHGTYIVMSADGGNTWKRFTSSEFTGFAHVIREDIVNEKLLFLGTEMGLFISFDAGATWMRSKYQNIPWYALVRDIKIHPQTNDLIIATHGRGIYIIDNLQPLREMSKANLNSDFIFFPIQTYTIDYNAQYPQPSANLYGWYGDNTVLAPTFYYYLKQRSNDAVKIEIFDANNKSIIDINGSGLKGLNKVYWGLNSRPPRVAVGGMIAQSSMQRAGLVGPRVVPGKYKVVIKADGKEYVQSIDILPNPQKGFTLQEAVKLKEQATRLFNLEEKLFYLVDTTDKTIARLTAKNGKNEKEIKQLQQLADLRKELVETNRKSIFFDETKFRKKVSDLYLTVATAIEPLSNSKASAIEILEKEFEDWKQKIYDVLK
ncbi:MAG: hypothetical protein K2X26_06495 [Chitinophagaceae bacterium]|nr:hypothetical protein [Chitinophagaceae bacterium]